PREIALSARGPADLDALDARRVPEAEVERKDALREVSGLAVVVFRVDAPARGDSYRGAQAVAVGDSSVQQDLEEMDLPALREVADQNLRCRVELVGDDVQVAVTDQIEEGGRPRADRSHHGDLALLALADLPVLLGIAIQIEP